MAEIDKDGALERFYGGDGGVQIQYEFDKKKGIQYVIQLRRGDFTDVYCIAVEERSLVNGNRINLTEFTLILSEEQEAQFALKINELFDKVTSLKFPRSREDILNTICPELLDAAFLSSFEEPTLED